jgi:alkanesulfonate monooxygenase SsuD/methylene tetrahydromethanopterin reductase-like flavin-dependent oxidoreductase (luciferase family)
VFVWDGITGNNPWVILADVAMQRTGVRLGPTLIPPSRRRPWKLAQETATLDRLSGSRLVLPVGLGPSTLASPKWAKRPTARRGPQYWTRAWMSWRASGMGSP